MQHDGLDIINFQKASLRIAFNPHSHRDFFSLASTPCDEDCTQAGYGTDNYTWQLAECIAYRNQLIRQYGFPPED